MLNKRKYIKHRLEEIDSKLDTIMDPAEAVALASEKMRLIEEDTENDKRIFGYLMNVLEIGGRILAVAIPSAVALKQLEMQNQWFYDGLKFEEKGTFCADMNKNVHRGLFRGLH